LPGQATTGFTPEQFDELVDRVGQRVVWDSGRGRPRTLTLQQAVKAVVMYLRTNVTEEFIAELLFVDQSTISRMISDLEEIIAEALDEFVPSYPRSSTVESPWSTGRCVPGGPGLIRPSCTPGSTRPPAMLGVVHLAEYPRV
jgi:hypothetical protein